jgi:phosphatidylglycerophosphate synthase
MENKDWQTKPTDRLILKWIKVHLSAHLTRILKNVTFATPIRITILSCILGCLAGCLFALGYGFLAGCFSAVSQILDGVDGQLARISGRVSRGGAFWDSVLDRYADGFLGVGLIIYLLRFNFLIPKELIILVGIFALIGSSLMSYSTARAQTLDLELGKPTLASKGTRTTIITLCAIGSAIWPKLPIVALFYLFLHTNLVIIKRLLLTIHQK